MPFIGNQPALSYTSFAKQDFTTSATTSYTLDNPVTNENELALFINFVRQEPGTAYTASGTTLTLTSATSATDDMYCVYLGKAVQTVNPPNGSVGTAQLVDGQVTNAKLQNSSITLNGSAVSLGGSATVGGTNTPSFMAKNSGGQTLTNNATNVLAANVEVFDSNNAFNTSTYRFTVPSGEGGKYLFGLGCQFETGSAGNMGNFALRIRVNNSTVIDGADYPGGTNENRIPYKYTSGILDLSAGDYVEPAAYISLTTGTPSITPTLTFYGVKLIGV